MLAIRLQRTGRSGHAMFRIIVQDSRKSAASGKIVAYLGNYDPHTKKVDLDKEKASLFLKNGAQPSDRTAGLLKSEGVKLPDWVSISSSKKRAVKNTEKRRSTATAKPVEETKEAEPSEETALESSPAEAPIEAPVVDETATETESAIEPEASEESPQSVEESPEVPAEEPADTSKDS